MDAIEKRTWGRLLMLSLAMLAGLIGYARVADWTLERLLAVLSDQVVIVAGLLGMVAALASLIGLLPRRWLRTGLWRRRMVRN